MLGGDWPRDTVGFCYKELGNNTKLSIFMGKFTTISSPSKLIQLLSPPSGVPPYEKLRFSEALWLEPIPRAPGDLFLPIQRHSIVNSRRRVTKPVLYACFAIPQLDFASIYNARTKNGCKTNFRVAFSTARVAKRRKKESGLPTRNDQKMKQLSQEIYKKETKSSTTYFC